MMMPATLQDSRSQMDIEKHSTIQGQRGKIIFEFVRNRVLGWLLLSGKRPAVGLSGKFAAIRNIIAGSRTSQAAIPSPGMIALKILLAGSTKVLRECTDPNRAGDRL